MADELQIIPSSKTPDISDPAKTVNQNGERNTYIGHAEQVNVTVNSASPILLQPVEPVSILDFNRDYYNIIVGCGLDFFQIFNKLHDNSDYLPEPFVFDPSRALTEIPEEEIRKEFSPLSEDAIKKITTFPTIFANENNDYGKTDDEQLLGLGRILKVKVRNRGVVIYPQIIWVIHQHLLNKALLELDLWGDDSINEFNRTHWSIRKIDLIKELQELGLKF